MNSTPNKARQWLNAIPADKLNATHAKRREVMESCGWDVEKVSADARRQALKAFGRDAR